MTASTIGHKRALENAGPSLPVKKRYLEHKVLSQETILERIKTSLEKFESSYCHIQSNYYASEPKVHFAFNRSTGEMMSYFPGAYDRLQYEVVATRKYSFKAALANGLEEDVPQQVRDMVQTVLEIIHSKSECTFKKCYLKINCIKNLLYERPLGTEVDIDIEFRPVKSHKKIPYYIGERVIFCTKDLQARIASVKKISKEDNSVTFSFGPDIQEEIIPLEALSDVGNPVLFRDQRSNRETVVCYPWKIVIDFEGLQSLSDEELLDFWRSRAS